MADLPDWAKDETIAIKSANAATRYRDPGPFGVNSIPVPVVGNVDLTDTGTVVDGHKLRDPSLVDQFFHGMSGGLYDKAIAGAGAGILSLTENKPFSKTYNDVLDARDAQYKDLKERRPVTATAADLAGAVSGAVLPVSKAGIATTFAGRLAQYGTAGATQGAFHAAGHSRGDYSEQLDEILHGAGSGAVTGAVLGGGSEAVGGGARKLVDAAGHLLHGNVGSFFHKIVGGAQQIGANDAIAKKLGEYIAMRRELSPSEAQGMIDALRSNLGLLQFARQAAAVAGRGAGVISSDLARRDGAVPAPTPASHGGTPDWATTPTAEEQRRALGLKMLSGPDDLDMTPFLDAPEPDYPDAPEPQPVPPIEEQRRFGGRVSAPDPRARVGGVNPVTEADLHRMIKEQTHEKASPVLASVIKGKDPIKLALSADRWTSKLEADLKKDPKTAPLLGELRRLKPGSVQWRIIAGHLASS